MDLIDCEACGNKVASNADSCPHCGFKFRKTGPWAKGCLIIIVTIIIILIIIMNQ